MFHDEVSSKVIFNPSAHVFSVHYKYGYSIYHIYWVNCGLLEVICLATSKAFQCLT